MDGQHDTRDGPPKQTRLTAKISNSHGLQWTKYTLNNIIILTGEDDYSKDRFPTIHSYTVYKYIKFVNSSPTI